jgi:hypothetical protein
LSFIIAPCFENSSRLSTEDDFATWGQSEEEFWEARRTYFIDTFQKALTLKAKSILNSENYRLTIFPRGTRFEEKTMVEEAIEQLPRNEKNTFAHGRKVKLCTGACVKGYLKPDLHNNKLVGVEEALVNLSNWSDNIESREGISPRVLQKAVVILEDDQPIEPKSDSDTAEELKPARPSKKKRKRV